MGFPARFVILNKPSQKKHFGGLYFLILLQAASLETSKPQPRALTFFHHQLGLKLLPVPTLLQAPKAKPSEAQSLHQEEETDKRTP